MRASRCINKLSIDSNAIGNAANATLEDIAHVQLTADLANVFRSAFEPEA